MSRYCDACGMDLTPTPEQLRALHRFGNPLRRPPCLETESGLHVVSTLVAHADQALSNAALIVRREDPQTTSGDNHRSLRRYLRLRAHARGELYADRDRRLSLHLAPSPASPGSFSASLDWRSHLLPQPPLAIAAAANTDPRCFSCEARTKTSPSLGGRDQA